VMFAVRETVPASAAIVEGVLANEPDMSARVDHLKTALVSLRAGLMLAVSVAVVVVICVAASVVTTGATAVTVKDCELVAAEYETLLTVPPAAVAVTVQVPAPMTRSCHWPPVSVAVHTIAFEVLKVTVCPDDAVAVNVNGSAARERSASALNEMVWYASLCTATAAIGDEPDVSLPSSPYGPAPQH